MEGGRNPFRNRLVPVARSVKDILSMLERYRRYSFCLYLAEKTPSQWRSSTSRRYMNRFMRSCIYLPVNVSADDRRLLSSVYQLARKEPRIVGINHTAPHKNNAVLRRIFRLSRNVAVIDVVVRSRAKVFRPLQLNGPSFIRWYEEVGSLRGRKVLVLGYGGAGEPIARAIALQRPSSIAVMEKRSGVIPRNLSGISVIHLYNFAELPAGDWDVVVNATGTVPMGLQTLLSQLSRRGRVFIDLRPNARVAIVTTARKMGWRAFTGVGMNIENDYELFRSLARVVSETPVSYQLFEQEVRKVS